MFLSHMKCKANADLQYEIVSQRKSDVAVHSAVEEIPGAADLDKWAKTERANVGFTYVEVCFVQTLELLS